MKYQNSRGGRLVFQNVVKPAKMEWQSGQEALEDALGLERLVNQSLLDLHKVAEEVNDPHLQDFIEGEFLTEQVESIKEIGDLITQAKRCGKGLGEYQFDQLTMQKKNWVMYWWLIAVVVLQLDQLWTNYVSYM